MSPSITPLSPAVTPLSPAVAPLSTSTTQLSPVSAPPLSLPPSDKAADAGINAAVTAVRSTVIARSTAVSKHVPPYRRKNGGQEKQISDTQEYGKTIEIKVKPGAVVPGTSSGGVGKYIPPWKRKLLAKGSF